MIYIDVVLKENKPIKEVIYADLGKSDFLRKYLNVIEGDTKNE